ncbi:hypothetical protein M569_08069 [Genlisea aurea]|uniref:Protein kinase domain-containing protein n=1 Tax=Genlisea aurea TaxID=192259 RepID=S8E351_9LAMI|nr:hypothetical protein M569_08069 [Genlisea aurea]
MAPFSTPSIHGVLPVEAGLFDHSNLHQTGSFLRRLVMTKRNLSPPGHLETTSSQSGQRSEPSGLSQLPLSPNISKCCGSDMVPKRDSLGCQCVYPIKIELLLVNISSNPDWNMFLEQFAYQLGLRVSQIELINFFMVSISGLNISMDITPHKGLSFVASEASAINSSLVMHTVHLNPSLLGNYQLLNFTWFRPLEMSEAPASAASPAAAPSNIVSTPEAVATLRKSTRPGLVLFTGVGAFLLMAAIIATVVIRSRTSRRKKCNKYFDAAAKQMTPETFPASSGSLRLPASTRFLTYDELKTATNNFESSCILGEGGFGRVFKGRLGDGTPVAIKRLSNCGQQGDKEFLVEVEMLSRLHHRNLVKLVGYYTNRDSENLLCYELVPNGSLESWLHGPLGLNCPLDWDTRMKIALDAARGLAYLHEDSQPSVIHRDFKASNILLENNFHAKVSDFGLAKHAPEGRTNYLSTRVMGTFGYVAPEYAMTGHLLVKSDVYSYGVVLLELLTGRKPVDMSRSCGQENLVTWARPILTDRDRLDELADHRLKGNYPREDFSRVCTIAAACVAPEASQRPTMGEVVQSLKMVQRAAATELHRQCSIVVHPRQQAFESDASSSMFSSGPYSTFDNNEFINGTLVYSEDLQEGR